MAGDGFYRTLWSAIWGGVAIVVLLACIGLAFQWCGKGG